MGKELKLALMYRDMWQSSGKYMPRADQLEKVAEPIIEMGCFARVETNGGGFEQINLLFGENPNHSVRRWTKAFNQAGIQTQMLERGLNGLSMRPMPLDVRKLLFKVKKIQGTDISRSFDGLNNPQNLEKSFAYAKEGGMIAQAALSITHSPLHTVEYYIQLADQFIDLGAQEIAIKDMAGIGRPVSIGRIVKGVRERHPNIIIQFHSHTTPGFSVTSALEAARNGADIIDVGMEPLSWGTGHPDLLTIHAMLKDAGFSLPDINKKAYMEVRTLTQSFIDDFLGYYMNPNNRKMNALLIGPGLPGGMMGSLMADLENNLKSLNKWLEKRNLPNKTEDELLLALFDEVEYAWPKLGYPPLVTPFSQYVKNVSLVNAINLIKGKQRWEMIDENTWGMILGRSGQLLGPVGEELKELAADQNREFFTGNPQDLYPDQLPIYQEKMKELGWEKGPDDEELLEYAMHPEQYERFKSGQAKEEFLKDLEQKRQPKAATTADATAAPPVVQPTSLKIEIDGVSYQVKVSYAESEETTSQTSIQVPKKESSTQSKILAPLEGKFYLTKDPGEKGIQIGDLIAEGDAIGYIESMKVMNAITADKAGKVTAIVAKHGEEVEEDDVLVNLN
jgi:pyruvate carboxylase subunit B